MALGFSPLASSIVFTTFSIFPALSSSHPTTPRSDFNFAQALNLRSSPQCGFAGNNDIYGIGIRIGIYTQIFAVWIANYFLFSQAQILRDSITIFTVALLAVSFMFVASPSSSYAIEAFILFQVLSWSCMMGVRAKSRYSKLNSRNTVIRAVVSEAINLCSISLQVWFWWRGLDQMLKTPCGTYIWYLVKTDIYGWARTVMKVLSLFVLCVTSYLVAIEGTRAWSYFALKYTRETFEFAIMEFERTEIQRRLQACSDDPTAFADPNGGTQSHNGSITSLTEDSSECSPVEQTTLSHKRQTSLDGLSMGRRETSVNTLDLESSNHDHGRESQDAHPASQSKCESRIGVAQTTSILKDVYMGEIYIKNCISAGPYQRLKSQQVTIIKNIRNISPFRSQPKKTPAPAALHPFKGDVPSYLTCQFQILKALVTFKFPKQAFVLYTHLRHSRLLEPWNGPYQVYAALSYSDGPLPPAFETALASSLMLTKVPKKAWMGWYNALLDLAEHVIVILQLELSIRWNRIGGLLGLGSVGQLIPFITGVVGLGLIGGRWVELWYKRRGGKVVETEATQGEEEQNVIYENGLDGLDGSVVAGYYRWREAYEASLEEGKSLPNAEIKAS
jgi:hypothetical protein